MINNRNLSLIWIKKIKVTFYNPRFIGIKKAEKTIFISTQKIEWITQYNITFSEWEFGILIENYDKKTFIKTFLEKILTNP